MQRFVDAIGKSIQSEIWFPALFMALAVPDICGSLEYPRDKHKPRYIRWYSQYLKERYDPSNHYEQLKGMSPQLLDIHTEDELKQQKNIPYTGPKLTALDCYLLRSRCVHEGLPLRSEQKAPETRKLHFTIPSKGPKKMTLHLCQFDGVLQIPIDIFCGEICKGVVKWLDDVSQNIEIQGRMKDLIEVYSTDDPRFPLSRITRQ